MPIGQTTAIQSSWTSWGINGARQVSQIGARVAKQAGYLGAFTVAHLVSQLPGTQANMLDCQAGPTFDECDRNRAILFGAVGVVAVGLVVCPSVLAALFCRKKCEFLVEDDVDDGKTHDPHAHHDHDREIPREEAVHIDIEETEKSQASIAKFAAYRKEVGERVDKKESEFERYLRIEPEESKLKSKAIKMSDLIDKAYDAEPAPYTNESSDEDSADERDQLLK